ncbi:hypothetical protein VTK73DRAFT_6891 [Phialemonium thermophilum]|uniref:Uncharacterized protein n=1 Tax=Phialemonium thermophilum TaxID=223376 RepID=A0ABR3WHI9_9PEZI
MGSRLNRVRMHQSWVRVGARVATGTGLPSRAPPGLCELRSVSPVSSQPVSNQNLAVGKRQHEGRARRSVEVAQGFALCPAEKGRLASDVASSSQVYRSLHARQPTACTPLLLVRTRDRIACPEKAPCFPTKSPANPSRLARP